ncbi:methyltransferase domain-containing protein [Comamonas nitrativorans]|uniref:Methyltransferase domain-containing protein n=1 Tax=Comamonas nitrativorans TaxID=108437 RepID=A0ABV9GVN0_9BURK
MSHQLLAYNKLSHYVNFSGKIILEIGGNQKMESVVPFMKSGADKIFVTGLGHISKNNIFHDGRIEILRANGHDIRSIFGDNIFDCIYGLSIVEHITQLSNFLEQVFYVLKPGGLAFFEGSPIWSSKKGHHLWVRKKNINYLFDPLFPADTPVINPIPDWGHLLFGRDELKSIILRQQIPDDDVELIMNWIFNNPEINRYFHRDISVSFSSCPLITLEIGNDCEVVPAEVLNILRAKHGSMNNYGVNRVQYVLAKP